MNLPGTQQIITTAPEEIKKPRGRGRPKGKEIYKCDKCGLAFTSEWNLSQHKREERAKENWKGEHGSGARGRPLKKIYKGKTEQERKRESK